MSLIPALFGLEQDDINITPNNNPDFFITFTTLVS